MTEDPIVAEVREARAKLMAQCDYDLNKLYEMIKHLEQQHPEKMINRIVPDSRGKRAFVPPPPA